MMVRYRSRKSNDAELRARLRSLTHERRRFGYRGLHVLLKRQGDAVSTSAWRSSPTPRSWTSRSPHELDRLLGERGKPKSIASDI
jgi:heme-degrading monooxygenase HmoA